MDSKSESSNGKFRVVLLPWLASSHISAFLELAKRMSIHNFHVYVCSTPIHFPAMKRNLAQKYAESIQLVDLNMPSSPEFPPHFHTTNGLPPHLKNRLIFAHEECRPQFTAILENLKPHLVVYDYNQWWAVDAASSFNIPCVQFLIGSVIPCVVFLHKAMKQAAEQNPIPGFNVDEYKITNTKEDDHDTVNSPPEENVRVGRSFLLSMRKSHDIILVKSTRELEGKFMDFISQTLKKHVLPVGPLFPESSSDGNDDQHIEIFRWLDQKKQASVVYVCFGAEYYLSEGEIQDIVYGLEHSNVNFIWVLRFPAGGNNKTIQQILPKGFLQRIGDRGMFITKWAPQARILDHSSTGGFLCHCGWVSVLESIYYCVPIIGLPMQYDHPCNAKLIEKLGIGIIVGRNEDGRLKKVEMAESVIKVMTEDGPGSTREKMHNLSEIMRKKGHQEVDKVVTEHLAKMCNLKMW